MQPGPDPGGTCASRVTGGEAPPGHHLRLAGPALFWIPRDRPLTGTSDVHGCPQPSSWTPQGAGRQINCRDPELSWTASSEAPGLWAWAPGSAQHRATGRRWAHVSQAGKRDKARCQK